MRFGYWIVVLVFAEALTCHARATFAGSSSVNPHSSSGLSKGTWEVSMASGYTYTYRRTDSHTTQLKGIPVVAGVGMIATDPLGASWYRGQATVGGEALFIQYVDRLMSYLAAFTPTLKYTFLAWGRLRPYIEAGAGLVWTDLGNRIPEKGSKFNFNLQAGAGLSYFVAATTSINVSYRFQHISNAGTAEPNHGIDAGLLLIGISKLF